MEIETDSSNEIQPFQTKKIREKITMEYYEGNRTRNWKEKQEQDGNERNGY